MTTQSKGKGLTYKGMAKTITLQVSDLTVAGWKTAIKDNGFKAPDVIGLAVWMTQERNRAEGKLDPNGNPWTLKVNYAFLDGKLNLLELTGKKREEFDKVIFEVAKLPGSPIALPSGYGQISKMKSIVFLAGQTRNGPAEVHIDTVDLDF